jgi:N-acetylglucosaminyldiphosphoundecaprenol N-acetyl-beta-D-mannosaminyltransferase
MPEVQQSTDERIALRARNVALIEHGFSPRSIHRRRLARYGAALWLAGTTLSDAGKRAFDLAISGTLLLLLAPLLVFLHSRRAKEDRRLVRTPRLGRWGVLFDKYSFPEGRFSDLPVLINVWKGDMSIVGPRPITPGAGAEFARMTARRSAIRPGVLCLWWIRTRANTAYGNEPLADAEYIETQSFMGDLGIALRAVPASLSEGKTVTAPPLVNLLGIPINNLTMEEAVARIMEKCRAVEPSQVCFVNADCANIACNDQEYSTILKTCGLVFADGIGVRLAGKILNRNIKQNVNGTDMLAPLCRAMEKNRLGLFLLGGKPGVAADVAHWMEKTFPGLSVRGHRNGYFTASELPGILETIRDSGAAVLLVAFGVPKQESWIRDHLRETGAKVAIGVGGLLDFYSGRIPRAPEWMRELGMEWLYRFWQEPRRMWRRYFIGNAVFLWRVFRDRSPRSESL